MLFDVREVQCLLVCFFCLLFVPLAFPLFVLTCVLLDRFSFYLLVFSFVVWSLLLRCCCCCCDVKRVVLDVLVFVVFVLGNGEDCCEPCTRPTERSTTRHRNENRHADRIINCKYLPTSSPHLIVRLQF